MQKAANSSYCAHHAHDTDHKHDTDHEHDTLTMTTFHAKGVTHSLHCP